MAQETQKAFGVHSEVGKLHKVMVCAPGRAHQRLTPSNCDQLLFDDVLWVDNAKRDHFDFMQKMRDRGVEVVEMHSLLAETVAIPEAKKWILDNQVVPNQVGLGLVDAIRTAGFGLLLDLVRLNLAATDLVWFALGVALSAWVAWRTVPKRA